MLAVLAKLRGAEGKCCSSNALSSDTWCTSRACRAVPGAAALQDYTARWDPTNPNVLTLACRGNIVETKVTKRSYESPFDGAFVTSEYARIADAGHDLPLRVAVGQREEDS